MSDSTNILNQVSTTAIQRETTINANFAQASPAMTFGYNSTTSAALTWGYMGGRVDGTSVASGTVALTASNDNYVVAHRTTLAVTVATTTTNWSNTATYARLYKVVAGASTVTSYEDHRLGATGLFGSGSGSGASLSAVNVWTKNQSVPFVELTDGTNIAVDASLSNNFHVILGGNRTLDNPSNLTDGMILNFYIEQDGTGTRTLAFGSKYKFAGGSKTLSTAISARDFISACYNLTDDILLCNLTKAYA